MRPGTEDLLVCSKQSGPAVAIELSSQIPMGAWCSGVLTPKPVKSRQLQDADGYASSAAQGSVYTIDKCLLMGAPCNGTKLSRRVRQHLNRHAPSYITVHTAASISTERSLPQIIAYFNNLAVMSEA